MDIQMVELAEWTKIAAGLKKNNFKNHRKQRNLLQFHTNLSQCAYVANKKS